MGVWIDEKGRIVRLAEPAWTANHTLKVGERSIVTEGERYVAALRDWVSKGERSAFVLSDEEFARRVRPRSAAEMEAEASFKLAIWFHQHGDPELAARHWRRAEELNPADWNYHRQDWNFTPKEAGAKWLEKFQKLDQPYYPKLDLP
jgi:hypothetical protein